MSEHAWVQDNLAAYVAGGLDAVEAERVERHAAECPDCAAAVRDARALDHGLHALFAPVRPEAALEDRMIQALRTASAAPRWLRLRPRSRWGRRLAWGTAATVAVGLTGAGLSRLIHADTLLFPGNAQWGVAAARNDLRQLQDALDFDDRRSYVSGPDPRGAEGLEYFEQDNLYKAAILNGGISNTIIQGDGVLVPWADYEANGLGFLPPSIGKYPNVPGTPIPGSILQGAPAESFRGRFVYGAGLKPPDDVGKEAKPEEMPEGKSHDKPPAPPPDVAYFQPEQHKAQPEAKPARTPEKVDKDKEEKKELKDGERRKEWKDEQGQPDAPKPGTPQPPQPAPEQAAARKVIRSGEVEFEVASFDSAVATVTKLVTGIKGAFVATVNSEKLPNGKVKGSLVVRVPPEQLDGLVLDLRKELGKAGELKGQRIGSQDITKQYTDLESRLKAAKTMEQRLLQIIKEGKGEIKQLLEAEKELGNWRTKIEELEGEIRYYANLVSLSTLTVTLAERELGAAAGLVECERVQAGVEVEDVDKAQQLALAAVAEAKGRVTKAEVKQFAAGQYSATLHFEVAPEAAGPLRDRLRQLGNLVRLEIDRVTQAEDGQKPGPGAKVRRGDTQFFVSLYNLANVQPRETVTVQLAAPDVPAAYRAIVEVVAKVKGRVVTGQLNEQDRQNVTAQVDFEVRRGDVEAVQAALAVAGDAVSRSVSRAAQTENVTDAKVLYKASLLNAARLPPRETVLLGIEVADVAAVASGFAAHVQEAQGRVIASRVEHERNGRVTARLVYDVPLAAAPGLVAQFKGAGTVRSQQVARDPAAPDGKLALARIDVTLSNAELIVPTDDGLWPRIRQGLSFSVYVLSWSVTWLIVGLSVALPWALVGYGGYRLVRRLFRSTPATPPAPAA